MHGGALQRALDRRRRACPHGCGSPRTRCSTCSRRRPRTGRCARNSPPPCARRPDGDDAPLARLLRDASQRGEGGEEERPARASTRPCTSRRRCEEELFPWNRAASPAEAPGRSTARRSTGCRRARSRRSRRATCSRSATCPRARSGRTRPPPRRRVQEPFPSVPTLILSGADDLRTPTANARVVAAQIPGLAPRGRARSRALRPQQRPQRLCRARRCRRCSSPRRSSHARAGRSILSLLQLAAAGADAPVRRAPAQAAAAGAPDARCTRCGSTLADLARQVTVQALGALASGDIAGLSVAAHRRPARGLGAHASGSARAPRLLLRTGRDRLREDHRRTKPGCTSAARGRARDAAPRRAPRADRHARRPARAEIVRARAWASWRKPSCTRRARPRVPLLSEQMRRLATSRYWRLCCPRWRSRSGRPPRSPPLNSRPARGAAPAGFSCATRAGAARPRAARCPARSR